MVASLGGKRILVVDDAPIMREVLERTLREEGYQVFTSPGVGEALSILEDTPIDLVITDMRMPRVDGLDLVRHVRENFKDTEVMMITGYPSIKGAVEAVRTGAEDYLSKPFTDEELMASVSRLLERLKVRRINRDSAQESPVSYHGLIGESDAMRKLFLAIAKAGKSSATVLITGESGAGKELVARAIHYNSPRASEPFVPVNCGGIPEGLVESELFGHLKGAFTGASSTRTGFFHTADDGTIFLDEISEMSPAVQVKLLRVLQNGEVYMVGTDRPRSVNIRVLAATNKDLPTQVEKGGFREDLYYRLKVVTIAVPPLRQRGDDILLLARHFAAKFAEEQGKPVPRFSEDTLQLLRTHYWPGNVRELENTIQGIVVMADGEYIEIPDMPSLMRFSALRAARLNRTLAEVEAEHIRNVLASVGGNRTRAAEILGISRRTIQERLKKLALPTP